MKRRHTVPPSETLGQHPLIRAVIDNLGWVFEDVGPRMAELISAPGGLRMRGKVTAYPACDLYDRRIFDDIAKIVGTLDRLRHAARLAEARPQSAWRRWGVTHDVWLEYHYSFFVICASSLSDLALMLVSHAFRLGLPVRECTPRTVKDNEWVRHTSVSRALDDLERTLKEFRELKNRQFHQGETPDFADLTDSDVYDLLKLVTLAGPHKFGRAMSRLVSEGFAVESMRARLTLEAKGEKATSAVRTLFDTILPVYKKTEGDLHRNPPEGCRRRRNQNFQ